MKCSKPITILSIIVSLILITLKYSHFVQTEMYIFLCKQPLNSPPWDDYNKSMFKTFNTLFKDKHALRIP